MSSLSPFSPLAYEIAQKLIDRNLIFMNREEDEVEINEETAGVIQEVIDKFEERNASCKRSS